MKRRRASRARAVLVTGGARRIGRAIAIEFARRGWDVAVHYGTSRSDALATVREIESLGRRAVAIGRDLAVERGARKLVPDAIAALGRLDCVVNNASLFDYDDAASFRGATLIRHLRVNTIAPVLLAHALHEALASDARGVVINLLDQKLWNPNPDFFSYTLSKSALKEATTLLALALAPKVRVVGVAPGMTLPSHLQDAAAFERTHRMAPLGQASTPEDVASAVAYAADAHAMTGTNLLVDGGQHLVRTDRDFSFL
ncbi:MAG: SDR family oxidoreductase [Burkholderiaceae bacterium]